MEGVIDVDDFFDAFSDGVAEGVIEFFFGDENNGIETGAFGVDNGIIEKEISVIVHRFRLL